MFEAWYQENQELPTMIGKYRDRESATDACTAHEQTLVSRINPYWHWIEETT